MNVGSTNKIRKLSLKHFGLKEAAVHSEASEASEFSTLSFVFKNL